MTIAKNRVTIDRAGEYGDESGSGVYLYDGYGEIVMWDQQEWVDEPSLVLVIAECIELGLREGGQVLRRRVNRCSRCELPLWHAGPHWHDDD